MIDIAEKIKELDFEDLNVMVQLGSYYRQWLEWNKYYDFHFNMTQMRAFQSHDIIVIHNLWKENGFNYNIDDGERFLEQIAYLIDDWIRCREFNDDDLKNLYDFWENKIDKLNG